MRALIVYKRTTPTYRFTITDAVSAGIDINAVSIGMALTDSSGKTYLVNTSFNGVNPGVLTGLNSYDYRYNGVGTSGIGWISLTLPISFTATVTGAFTYEVFLYKAGIMVVIDNGTLEMADSSIPTLATAPIVIT